MDGPTRVFDDAPPIAYIRRERFVPRWWRWRSYLKAAAIFVVLMLLSTGGYFFSQRNVATKVTTADAVVKFRSEARAISPRSAVVDGPSRQDVAGRRVAAQSLSPATRLPSHARGVAQPYLLPAEGVYTFHTTGGESISIAGAHHDYPPETTGTIRHLGGCRWLFTNNVIKEHTDYLTMCSRPNDMYQLEQARYVTFYEKTDGQDFTFTPPELVAHVHDPVNTSSSAVGESTQHDGEVDITRTFAGQNTMEIGGRSVLAIHIHLESTSTGRSVGTSTDDVWLDPTTSTLLRWKRHIEADASTVFGNIHYHEEAEFVLASLTPQT